MLRLAQLALATVFFTACSSSEEPPNNAAVDSAVAETTVDTGALVADSAATDSATVDSATVDSATVDSATVDSATVDSATVDSATVDSAVSETSDSGGCHGGTFGAPATPITKVTTLPTMTGGTIVPGVYDATDAKTTGSTTGSYRATWTITAANIEAVEQLALSGMPPAPVPRTLTWSTSGTSFTRTQVCGGSTSFTNQFTVRTEGLKTMLDIRQDIVMFTFTKR